MADSNQRDPMPLVARPSAAAQASGGLQLFRSEVMAERQTQWLGTVMLAPRASFRLFTVVGLIGGAAILALLYLGEFTRTARINGWLVPQQGVVRIYAPRPGIVSSLEVAEGAEVRKGDRLLALSDELRSTTLGATQAQITQRLRERSASLAAERTQQRQLLAQQQRALEDRVRALNAEQEQMRRDIELLQERVAIARRNEALHREQYNAGYISEMRLQQVQAELIEQRGRLGAAECARLVSVRERMTVEAERNDLPLKVAKEIALLDRAIAQLEQERAEAEAKREIVVLAPHDGTVTAIHAVAGAKADAGAPLLSIVPPATRLEAHLYGASRTIGFVRPGQRVTLRYQAYPYQRFGHYEGVIANVSRTAMSPGELPPQLAGMTSFTGAAAGAAAEPVFRITVDLASQSVTAYGDQLPLQSGMSLEADVALEKRRLFEWMLDPLYTVTGRRG
jgi:membrane fusion protein